MTHSASAKYFIFGFPIFLLIVNFIAVWNGWYLLQNGFDKVLHFSGGFWAAALFLWIFNQRPLSPYNNFLKSRMVAIILIIALASFLGLFWEFFEFSYDHFVAIPYYVPIAQLGNTDTMTDLIADFFGGVVLMLLPQSVRRLLS